MIGSELTLAGARRAILCVGEFEESALKAPFPWLLGWSVVEDSLITLMCASKLSLPREGSEMRTEGMGGGSERHARKGHIVAGEPVGSGTAAAGRARGSWRQT